ncbi:MAG TPA: hybrid sensor histidine kinase/response regulator [Lachnospiraceae bacterium]|nr:hybrid sensor histidine kinase/response regulator [Lachnospiraceae bacterium]
MKKNVKKLLMTIAFIVAVIMFVGNVFLVYFQEKGRIIDETKNIIFLINNSLELNGDDYVPDFSEVNVNSSVILFGADKNNGNIITASNPKYLNQNLSDIGIDTDIKEKTFNGQNLFDNKYYMVIKYSFDGFDLYYTMSLMTMIRSIIINSILVLAITVSVFLVIGTVILKYIDEKIIKVIDRINKGLDDITTNYDAPDINENSTPEFERLSEHINFMKDSVVGNAKDAQEAVKAKSNFLSTMSHEIRTPINAVLGLDEMILRDSNEPSTIKYAEDIRSAGKTLLSLINDILDSSKIESGNMELVESSYKLSTVLTDVYNMILFRAQKKGLEFECIIDPDIPDILKGDEIRIKQCMVNLLTNAVKYTEKGSVKLTVSFKFDDKKHIRLNVVIADTGIGIKKEDLNRLFSPFERIDEIRNRLVEGTGLGMSIVKKLLALMNTKLKVRSEYGKGSEFEFEILQEVLSVEPIGDFEDILAKGQSTTESIRESFAAKDAKILVVDDTSVNLTVVEGLLKHTGLQIDTADSGEAAIMKVEENFYDIIFMDHMMPGMDGIEAMQHIRNMTDNPNANTVIIVLTANVVENSEDQYKSLGFDAYLTKPIDSDRLETAIMNFLPEDKYMKVTVEVAKKVAGTADEKVVIKDEKLKTLRGINLAKAIEYSGGEEVLYDVIKIFYASINEKADLIEKYYNEGNIKEYTVLVHALKSSARLIGAETLSTDAAYLESCGNKNDVEEIEANTPALLSLYRSYLEKFKEYCSDSDDDSKEVIDDESYNEAMNSVKEFAEAYDFDGIDEILNMLDMYRIPDKYMLQFTKVKDLAMQVERDKIIEVLDA